MKTEKIIWGIVLVFIGSILLLQNFELIDFQWRVIFRFWPLILILIGANLLFSRESSKISGAVTIILTLLALGFIGYKGITGSADDSSWFVMDEEEDQSAKHSNFLKEEYRETIRKAVLNISGGATEYILRDSTDQLFSADLKRSFGAYSLMRTTNDTSEVLNFRMEGESSFHFGDRDRGNRATIKLNTRPLWDINIETGAGAVKFDLSPFKINKLNIEGGAASFKIKLGEPVATTRVSVQTGASEIRFSIPQSAACKITIESGLSANEFEGFVKQADGSYETENYTGADKSIVLNLEGGLSSFKVDRY
jgi:hypothetical protein